VDPDTGKFDEHKVVLGVNSTAAATDLYKSAFSDGKGEQRIGAVTPMTTEHFKEWLSGDTTKPLGMGPAKAVKQRKAEPKGPLSLLQMIAWQGGLKPDATCARWASRPRTAC
jgi:hypothetical protein